MNKSYYIYAYLRSKNSKTAIAGTPYYIGKGSGKRLFAKHGAINLPKIKSLIVILESNLTEIGALALERRLIRWFGRKDLNSGILHNKTDGGEGSHKRIMSIEYKQKNLFGENNPNWNNKWSKQQKSSLSKKISGINNHNYNKIWINNGIKNDKINKNSELPIGWVKGKLTFNPTKPYKWINNGRINIQIEKFAPIPDGFKLGAINKKHKKKELFLCNIKNKKQYDKCVASRIFPDLKHLF